MLILCLHTNSDKAFPKREILDEVTDTYLSTVSIFHSALNELAHIGLLLAARVEGIEFLLLSLVGDEMLDFIGIKRDKLPAIFPSHEVVGNVSSRVKSEFGLSTNTKVIAGSMDQRVFLSFPTLRGQKLDEVFHIW